MNSLKSIFKYIYERSNIILIVTVLILSILLIFSIKSCNSYKDSKIHLENSIEAIFDTVSYYKGKNGELVAHKKLLEGDIDILKIANEELYEKLKSMKQTGADHIVYVETVVENPPDSTSWEIDHNKLEKDSIEIKNFNFNNQWRILEGYITHTPNTLGLNITKDQINFDYTLAIKGNEVYMTSSNPYVKYNTITGLVIPETIRKKKHWSIGPIIYGGYDITTQKFGAGIGIGIMYDLWRF